MELKREWLAPCGLYCGVCGILYAHRDNNQNFKERLAGFYGTSPDEIRCEGCLSDVVFKYCEVCPIKTCALEHGYEGCHECDEFPCEHINNFPMPVGKKVMLRAIPQWRELGTEKWVEAEEKRYLCPHCGYKLFRGAKRCRNCKEPVDQD
jgi:hypothetical protein